MICVTTSCWTRGWCCSVQVTLRRSLAFRSGRLRFHFHTVCLINQRIIFLYIRHWNFLGIFCSYSFPITFTYCGRPYSINLVIAATKRLVHYIYGISYIYKHTNGLNRQTCVQDKIRDSSMNTISLKPENYHKNIIEQAAHTIVALPNHNFWLMNYVSIRYRKSDKVQIVPWLSLSHSIFYKSKNHFFCIFDTEIFWEEYCKGHFN